ncbi:GntR family transcriptional regulator [Sporosarcina aquimarina]|uniref:GntR family transcriptional regulator n=1 Tax=Sporosarcina aquimarina TaxID=114975 RepID=A0ABU4FY14_9BACL|nr:GntR family transcriptional regulator [Sporosarcina aquimarina]MDW0109541.1 GntR family transcriptional regulator [Sporosarcina aquimarina]
MFIQIEPSSDIPIYTQLANQIIELIARGQLNGGDTLPSVRALASDLSVNMHTVNKSYHELEQKGILRIVPKSGAVINPIVQEGITHENSRKIIGQLKPIIAEALVLGMSPDEIRQHASSILNDLKGE